MFVDNSPLINVKFTVHNRLKLKLSLVLTGKYITGYFYVLDH